MTSQEIKKYIKETAEKLADFLGDNGNQQNIAEGFETILNEIVDAIGDQLTISMETTGSDLTKEEFSAALGITEAEVDNLFRGDYKTVRIKHTNSFIVLPLTVAYLFNNNSSGDLLFGGQDDNIGMMLYVNYDQGGYNIVYTEV